jgi:thioredoxin reductase (NADPH)
MPYISMRRVVAMRACDPRSQASCTKLAGKVFETRLPCVFAVGDVRSGNVKRVVSAVGEGSIAITLIHQVLQP